MANNQFKDDDFTIIKSDLKKIMARPTMYISSIGLAGVLHLCKEIIDNNRDECYKKDSPGSSIYIEITDKWISSRDNGRGIPTSLMREVHETLQAGSNMTRAGGFTAGENGAGTSTYTAMASRLELITLRPQEKKKMTLIYENGELKNEKVEKYDGKEHGMFTKFYPSKKILGTDEIPVDELITWLQDFRFTLPKDITMVYKYNGVETKLPHLSLNVFFDNKIKGDQRMSSILNIKCSGGLEEIFMDKKYKRHFDIEAAIVYSDPQYKGETVERSWMNMIYNELNGSHMNGVKKAFSAFISEQVVKKNKRLSSEDLRKDVETNMHIVVKAFADVAHMFSAQAKNAVKNLPLEKAIMTEVDKALRKLPQSDIDEFVDICIANNRVRREGEKARDVTKLTRETKAWTKPDSFYPCSSVKTEQEKELFLVEGLSAGGGLRPARNARFQAILAFRGKSLNIWNQQLEDVLKSIPWLNLVKVLGTGIGANFNIKKLNYGKIIIATDADIDGFHIRVLFLIFFFKYMPEIIEQGLLYVAEPPLYQLSKGKALLYVANQREYIDECIKSVSDIEIEFPLR